MFLQSNILNNFITESNCNVTRNKETFGLFYICIHTIWEIPESECSDVIFKVERTKGQLQIVCKKPGYRAMEYGRQIVDENSKKQRTQYRFLRDTTYNTNGVWQIAPEIYQLMPVIDIGTEKFQEFIIKSKSGKLR